MKKIATENKIESIFAFSQGSLLSIILSILIKTDNAYKDLFKDLKCVILCAGFLEPFPNNEELIEHKEKIKNILLFNNDIKKESIAEEDNHLIMPIPILNVFGEADEIIKPEKSKNIEKLYINVESFNHPGKHFIPSAKQDIERYVSFLQKYLFSD